jgi:hypothetical protein
MARLPKQTQSPGEPHGYARFCTQREHINNGKLIKPERQEKALVMLHPSLAKKWVRLKPDSIITSRAQQQLTLTTKPHPETTA